MLEEIRSHLDFIGIPITGNDQQLRLLDYACGPGNISRAFAPSITSSIGIDISESMVAKFNKLFGSTPEGLCTGHAIIGDLCADPPSTSLDAPQLFDFDIAAVGVGFHHFHDPGQALQRLAERVKSGTGVVLILDWLPNKAGHHMHHDHGHGEAHDKSQTPKSADEQGGARPKTLTTVKTNGFSEEDMRMHFDAAGCTNFGFRVMEEPFVLYMGEGEQERRVEKTLFLARGTRKA